MAEENGKAYCSKCKRTLVDSNFYVYKDGTRAEICKKCLTMHVDNFDPDTFLWILEKFDLPYVEEEWNSLRDRAFAKDPKKMNGTTVLGKYLAKMRLKAWQQYHWSDTEMLKNRAKEIEAKHDQNKEDFQKSLKEARERGEISEAQYQTLADSNEQYDRFLQAEAQRAVAGGNHDGVGASNIFDENKFISEEDVPDLGEQLTQEDKIYLAMKWGRYYTPSEWVQLEQKYNEMKQSFNIKDSDTEGSLIVICKLYLKMNQALDAGDFEAFSKLSRSFDSMRKSSKFTAAQKKEEENLSLNSISEIVAFCEKKKGAIPQIDLSEERDLIDKELHNYQNWVETIIRQDEALSRQLEDYIKRRTIIDDKRRKKESGASNEEDDADILTIQDYQQRFETLEAQLDADNAIMKGEEINES